MARTPNDSRDSKIPAAPERREEKAATIPMPTRRQFVIGVSGVLGTAACGNGEPGGDGVSGSDAGGAATAGSTTAPGGAGSNVGGSMAASGAGSSAGGASGASGAGGAGVTGGTAAGGTASGGTASGGTASGGTASGGTAAGATASGGMTSGAMRKAASDVVVLGSTGIRVSRLAMGSGTTGSNRNSAQARLGVQGFSTLLQHAFDQGIHFFETADAYGTHEHVGAAIRQVGRQNAVVLTKTTSETAEGVERDLARFREELGVDTIDIVLLHLKTSGSWTTQCEGAMTALARAKQSGAIRAHGVSCHSLQALRLAAREPWVDVDLARINPAGVVMDAEPDTVVSVLREMKAAGKGVIGMKIFGEGQLVGQLDTCIKHAVELDTIDAFTIGFTSAAQLDEVVEKIARV